MILYVIAYRMNPESKIIFESFDNEDSARTLGGCIKESYGIPVRMLSINVGELGI